MKHATIVSRDFPLTESIEARVARRVDEIVARRDRPDLQVRVVVGDSNGPRGGVDKTCAMFTWLDGRELRAERVDVDLYVAIDRCAKSLDRSVRKRIERDRRLGRTAPPAEGAA